MSVCILVSVCFETEDPLEYICQVMVAAQNGQRRVDGLHLLTLHACTITSERGLSTRHNLYFFSTELVILCLGRVSKPFASTFISQLIPIVPAMDAANRRRQLRPRH